MKIEINENESYEFTIDKADLSTQEFLNLMTRLKAVEKIISKNDFIEQEAGSTTQHKTIKKKYSTGNKETWNRLRNDRELVVRLYKSYYCDSFKEFDDFLIKENLQKLITQRQMMGSGNLIEIRKRFDIKPQEVGLKAYPTQATGSNVRLLRIEQ